MIPPHDKNIERLVLGTLMTDKGAYDETKELLNPEIFYDDFNKKIYETIIKIVSKGDRPDAFTVFNELKKTTECDFMSIMDIANNNTFEVYQHAAILFDKARRRKFIEIGAFLTQNGFSEVEDIVDVSNVAVNGLNEIFGTSDNNIIRIDSVIKEVIEQINRNSSDDSVPIGTPTGFSEFDKKAGGLQPSDLIVIAGETSQGKTAFALSCIRNAALKGSKVAIYSLEMKNSQLTARFLAQSSGIPATAIMYQKFNERMFAQLDANLDRISKTEIYFDDRSTTSIDTIISSIRTMKRKKNIDGVLIDYIQILNPTKGQNKEQFMGDVTRRLKNLAKELDIWIIAISQLSRDHSNPEPTLNRLRDSGQIAEAADNVILIYRPEVLNRQYPEPFKDKLTQGTALIDIAKGRNIGISKFVCGFDKTTTLFFDMDIPTVQHIKSPDSLPF